MIAATKLVGGRPMPRMGIGTWPLTSEQVVQPVLAALELGYRAIDTAWKYGNQEGVGEAVRLAGIPRDELFITTKVDGTFPGRRAAEGLERCLDLLTIDHVDLLLIHWPLPWQDSYVETWATLLELQDAGLARTVGVSNFTPEHLRRIIDETGTAPAVNQIELNPYVLRQDHRRFHEEEGIATSSWSPLGAGNGLLDEPVVTEIALRHDRSPAQVVLRWHLQHDFVTMPKSTSRARLAENLAAFDFSLAEDEMSAIDGLGREGAGVDSDEFGH